MRGYDHKKIEKKWQKEWEKRKLYITSDSKRGKENFYLLVEFPYPSGNLHVGHWYAFAVPDILARMLRMQGKNVLYPIGFDAFGLPAENAAIKSKLNPRVWTYKNIEYMREQIESMGASFDTSREVTTCDPEYYKWTQWLFLQFFKNGLVYRKNTAVNWCPTDKTVLANEQVVDGKCERCGTEVVQKEMLQWNIRITDYADRLIDDLDGLDWPEQIKESQRNWIGRSEGAEIDFPLPEAGIKRFILLHGRTSSSRGAFLPWLKEKLEARGYAVEVPDLPGSDNPDAHVQADYVLKHCTLNEETAIVGHSSGGLVALRLLEKGAKLGRVTLVATPFSGKFLDGKKRPTVAENIKRGFDFNTIKKNAKGFILLYGSNDAVVPFSDGENLAQKINGLLIKGVGNAPHFNSNVEYDVLRASAPALTVFTTRADTLYGGTYLVLAPEHRWVRLAIDERHTILKNKAEVKAYVERSRKRTERERMEDREKTGVELRGIRAVNPATGQQIPIWIADFVIGSYGTGAVFADAHDERDFEFAKKYNIPLKETLEPLVIQKAGLDAVRDNEPFTDRQAVYAIIKHWSEDKYLCVRYKATDAKGLVGGGIEPDEDAVAAAKREIQEETGYTNTKLVRRLGTTIHSRFYSPTKKQNFFTHFTPLLFELTDGTQKEISGKEKAEHETSWVKRDEVDSFINREDFRIAWSRVQGDVCYAGKGILFDSAEFSGLTSEEAIPKIAEKFGRRTKQYHLRDWIVSRQRYWGVPIPIVHCPQCGAVPVPDKDLPVELPEVDDYLPEGNGKSPLAKATKWMRMKCPHCKGSAERETDTLDTFVDSSWYFLRYTDPNNKREFASLKRQNCWMPVDFYSGGPEHTTMHVLYSRFWHKALFDLGLVKDSEPYKRRMSHGLILGPDNRKMSKSHGNVIDPDDIVERLGADTLRLYLAFIGPYNEVGSYPWNPSGVVGVRRFLERVWRISEFVEKGDTPLLEILLHKTIKKVGDDINQMKFNTAISALMIFLNAVEKEKKIGTEQWRIFLQLLAPFAPHMTEELWHAENTSSIHAQMWPEFDAAKLREELMIIAVQINGKTRGETEVSSDADKSEQENAARDAVGKRLKDKKILRTIVVPGRLVNFVVEE